MSFNSDNAPHFSYYHLHDYHFDPRIIHHAHLKSTLTYNTCPSYHSIRSASALVLACHWAECGYLSVFLLCRAIFMAIMSMVSLWRARLRQCVPPSSSHWLMRQPLTAAYRTTRSVCPAMQRRCMDQCKFVPLIDWSI